MLKSPKLFEFVSVDFKVDIGIITKAKKLGEKMQTLKVQHGTLFIPTPPVQYFLILKALQMGLKTQNQLAKQSELSVAMVNNYMKRLASEGYIVYVPKNRKVISYVCTEQGLEYLKTMGVRVQNDLADMLFKMRKLTEFDVNDQH